MHDRLTTGEPDRLTDDARPSALADSLEADTPEEIRPQRVIVTANPYRYHDGLVLHMWEVTS